MKVYNAWSGPQTQLNAVVTEPPIRLLTSYSYDQGKTPLYEKIEARVPLTEVDLMGDSGAFSAWTIGKAVNLDGYIQWALDRRERFGQMEVINLDVIPGSPGKPAPKKERQRAIAQSEANADQIRSHGLPVMEVFHLYDEDFAVLERLWGRRRPGELLGIGGIAGTSPSTKVKTAFGDKVFSFVKATNGGWQNIPPLHGLGVSPDSALCHRWPWWSVDSSSWTVWHRFGAEVRRDGEAAKRTEGRGRTALKPMSDLYYLRVVQRWRRLEAQYTTLWNERGVTYDREVLA